MLTLKKKKNKSPDFLQIREKMIAVNDGIKQGMIKVEGNKVYIIDFFWKNKDTKYKKSFAKNMFIYVGINKGKEFDPNIPVEIFDLETKIKVSSFFNKKATIYR